MSYSKRLDGVCYEQLWENRLWKNCQKDDDKNRFLNRQFDLHQPQVVLFCGTAGRIKKEKRGDPVKKSKTFSNKLILTLRHLYHEGKIKRISIDFSKARMDNLRKEEKLKIREFIVEGIADPE